MSTQTSDGEGEHEVEALARAFARHLEHLREFRGVHYVGAAAVPVDPSLASAHERAAEDNPTQRASNEPRPQSSRPDSNHSQSPSSANHHGVAPAVAAAPRVATSEGDQSRGDQSRGDQARGDQSRGDQSRGDQSRGDQSRGDQWSAAKKLAYLRDRNVGDCRRCPLARTRQNIVFGVGDPEADLMFVGEAPGADEDRLGEPFVGVAGQRLDRWLAQLGLGRERVYISNVLKCRPPGNRDPQAVEIERCAPFLHAQIRAIEPKVIVALGRFAGCLLLGVDLPLYKMRGQTQRYREPKSGAEIPVVVTYHPSYVIRTERKAGGARGPGAQTDSDGAIKSEDQKVLEDLERAVSLTRSPTSSRG